MTRTIFIVCLMFMASVCFAQQKELDSLLQTLQNHRGEDTTRLRLLISTSYEYSFVNPEKGLEEADSAIILAKKLRERSLLASSYNYRALNNSALGNDSTALKDYNLGIVIRKELNDSMGLAKMYHNAGISYFNLSDYTEALSYQEEALDIFNALSYTNGIAATNNSIGVIYLLLTDYPKALHHYLMALKIYDQLKDSRNQGGVYTNVGIVYYHMADYKKALEYHFKSVDIFKKSGDLYSMQNTLGNIGETYDDMGDVGQSLLYYHQALDINTQLKNNRGIASSLVNIGIVYYGMPRYDSALMYLQKAAEYYEQTGDNHGLANALTYMSGVYLHASAAVLPSSEMTLNARYQKALALQNRGLALSLQTGNLSDQSEAWGNLSEIYAAQKDYGQALQAYRKHISLRDSVVNSEKKSQITRMGMQYEFDKRQAVAKEEHARQQALAAAEINKARIVKNFIVGVAAILLLSACIIFIFYTRKRNAETQKKEAEFKAQVAETEMRALRAQINPHFIFNSLNSIGDYISRHDTQSADFYLIRFSKMMRAILENADKKLISLADDLKTLEWYMQMEAMRLNNRFTYEITVEKEIDPENTLVPPLILQPFVENSIWHGLSGKPGGGKIRVVVKKRDQTIHCIVEDNGVGRKATMNVERPFAHSNGQSMGMKITRDRVNIINKMKKTAMAAIALTDLEEGLRVEVTLPFEPAF